MTFDKLCVYFGITYCKKGYLVCTPLCRFRNHSKTFSNKLTELPDRKIKIKSSWRQK